MEQKTHESRIRFEPKFDFGNVLTLIGLLAAIAAGWINLDKRVVVLEENRHTQSSTDKHQDAMTAYQGNQIRESLNKIESALVRLNNKVDALK